MDVIHTGDTVYLNRIGWSSVPMKVIDFRQVRAQNGGTIDQAVCQVGVYQGVYSTKYGCYVCAFYVGNLVDEPGRMGK